MKDIPVSLVRLLIVLVCVSFFSQIFFGRGLALDGVHELYKIIITGNFYFIESARITSKFFQQLPTWLFITFSPSNSLSILVRVFSFGLIWIHLIAFIGCYYILPKQKKSYLFFPLFSFLIGPLTGLGASIGASHCVQSYLWFVTFVIYYSKLSFKSQQVLFTFIGVPLILSHELMSYMAWPLIYLCMIKLKTEKTILNKFLIKYLISVLFVSSLVSIFFIFFQNSSELINKTEFFKALFYLEFFFKINNNHIEWIYPSCIVAFFLTIMPFGQFLSSKYQAWFINLSLICILLFGIIALIVPFYSLFEVFKLTEEEEARVWSTCLALPLSVLMWYLFENRKLTIQKPFILACILSMLSLIGWRIGSDYQFYQFQKQFSRKILNCKGFIFWNSMKSEEYKKKLDYDHIKQPYFYPEFLKVFNQGFKLTSSSLIYPRKFKIKSVIKPEKAYRECYSKIKTTAMCEFSLPYKKKNKFFDFSEFIFYIKNDISSCH